MPIVVGVSLRTAGKIYYFDPGTAQYDRDERVLVETARGLELGCVKLPPHEVSDEQIVPPLKNVVRRATGDDLARDAFNRDWEANALAVCKRLVDKLSLPMRLIDAQYTFDGSHVLIHFLADNRVDFRELVRMLAHELHTRIELRQVGVRDEAKLLGGHSICGRQLCCSTFLANFVPVAINTAKEQGLALNPQKISGMCGRLMCCLAFEHECYREVGKDLPRMNSVVSTPRGAGKVTKLNVLARQVEVNIPELPGPLWFPVTDLNFAASAEPAAVECPGCDELEEDAALANLEEPLAELAPDPVTVTVAGGGEEQSAISPEQPRRHSRHRRRKSGAPAAQQQAAPPAAEPSNGPSRPQRRPHDGGANVPVPRTTAAPPDTTAPSAPNPAGAHRRRRSHRRR